MTSRAIEVQHRLPVLTTALLLGLIAIFSAFASSSDPYLAASAWAVVPAEVTRGQDLSSLLTYGALHLRSDHLVINLILLGSGGVYFEAHGKRVLLFGLLLAGIIAGGLAHAFLYPESTVPLFGISAGALCVIAGSVLHSLFRVLPAQTHKGLAGLIGLAALFGFATVLSPALTGGIAMPVDLVESDMAHIAGLSTGLLFASVALLWQARA